MSKLLRKTLQLPKTTFPMRANAATREKEYTDRTTTQLYKWMREHRSPQGNNSAQPFQLHDGPPYANGGLHTGHLLNKVLKDITNRFQLLQGRHVRFVPGWDCHGLPIELKALEEGGMDRRSADALTIRATARECADRVVKIHRDSFIRWGIMADWDEGDVGDVYKTMDPHYESKQLEVLAQMMRKGFIKRGLKPVYWSPSSTTALAEAELEYNAEHRSTAIYCCFPIVGTAGSRPSQQELLKKFPTLEAVIWTTTPWTIPSNLAICANASMEYVVVAAGGRHLLMTEQAAQELFAPSTSNSYRLAFAGDEQTTASDYEVVFRLSGSEVVGLAARHPLREDGMAHANVPLLHGDHVTSDAGSGLVHTSPSHGVDDFDIYSAHLPNGPIFDIVTDDGFFIHPESSNAGQHHHHHHGEERNNIRENPSVVVNANQKGDVHDRVVHRIESAVAPHHASRLGGLELFKEGNSTVVDLLRSEGALLAVNENFIHSYPYDWRSKQPVMLRTTEQWFASLTGGGDDENGNSSPGLQQQALEAVEQNVCVVPAAGLKRLSAMLFGRSEWCISRQRVWGVPIPAFVRRAPAPPLHDDDDGNDAAAAAGMRNAPPAEVIMTPESILHFAKLVAQDPLGTNCWWTLPVEDLLPPVGSRAREAFPGDAAEYEKCTDTLDVWFDSGSSWNVVLGSGEHGGENFQPADLYLEGSDQHRGWFLSSLLTATACTGSAPYRTILTHGFCVDEAGKKMSKSIGNVVDPNELVHGTGGGGGGGATMTGRTSAGEGKKGQSNNNKKKKKGAAEDPAVAGYGADVCRIWAASSNFTTDVTIGATSVQKASEAVRKIRNVTRFLLGNLDDFDPDIHALPFEELRPLEQYMLHKLVDYDREMLDAYSSYNYNKGFRALMSFLSVDLSSFYMETTKDCLYTDACDGYKRRSAQTAYLHLLCGILSSMAPVLCFTAEDIHEHFPPHLKRWFSRHQISVGGDAPADINTIFSVFQYGWYNVAAHETQWQSQEATKTAQTWERAKQLRSSVLLLLEQARTGGLIRSPAEAQVYLLGPQGDASSPEQIRWQELTEALAPSTEALLTSQVTFLACPQTHEHRVSMARRAGGIDGWCLETSLEVGTCEVADSSTSDDTSKHIRIALTRADGAKCQRCWKFCPSAVRSDDPTLCAACATIVSAFPHETL